ncbi:outer membrane lipoprotein chaperone LolA [Aliidiomarina halalkaliphila]|uniref:Outer-membrane lipoprotein carrier protein n=1 Tax=Aliidiomarina halalkaliphila TaxID=2593535 RepID=A0A552X409_9GAMM|nr:outer membrane lipoprotein chaperone LolA [Aliidiomarina halalkaliphila]TRW49696.1 outer membrane lipoprotein chaperone LolA [Aliidiomarina halalkaliphila]
MTYIGKLNYTRVLLCMALPAVMAMQSVAADIATTEPKRALQAKLADLVTFQGEFIQEVYDGEDLIQEGTGHFYLERPAKLRWVTDAPDESTLVADGETLWYHNPFIEQVTLFHQSEAMQANPLLLLLDAEQANWDAFNVSYDGEKLWTVEEHPDAAAGMGSTLHLAFLDAVSDRPEDTNMLYKLILEDGHGQRSVFSLQDMQKNQPLPAQAFLFTIPDGTDIDDQRD